MMKGHAPEPTLRIDDDGLVVYDGRYWDPIYLINNLAMAGALCRADRLGYHRCAFNYVGATQWRPGCGRTAP